jgi:hypothetical protein
VGCVPTQPALLALLLGTLLRLVSPQFAAVTPDLAQVPIHEYRHFCWSSGVWGDRGAFWGMWSERCGKGECQLELAVYECVEVSVLNLGHGVHQLILHGQGLLGYLINALPRVSEQLVQGVLELPLSPIAVDLPYDAWVPHLSHRFVHYELLWCASCELLPLGCCHGGIVMGLSTDVDGDGVLGVSLALSASDIHIVGLILNVSGHLGMVLFVPVCHGSAQKTLDTAVMTTCVKSKISHGLLIKQSLLQALMWCLGYCSCISHARRHQSS